MHTIKGGARFFGLSRLAHAAENLLGKLRDGALPIGSEVTGILLTTVEKCRAGSRLSESQGSDAGFECEAVVIQLQAAENREGSSAKRPRNFSQPVLDDVFALGSIVVQGHVADVLERARLGQLKGGRVSANQTTPGVVR